MPAYLGEGHYIYFAGKPSECFGARVVKVKIVDHEAVPRFPEQDVQGRGGNGKAALKVCDRL